VTDLWEPIPISALEHFSYCRRQWALIHIEQIFEENVFTERGQVAHRRAHGDSPPDGRTRFGVRLWSDQHGLIGVADAVEFRPAGPYPVEYKLGRQRMWMHEAYQLCAQALCLEEMFGVRVPEGAIHYRSSQSRRVVRLTQTVRRATLDLVAKIWQASEAPESLPAPVLDARCRHCSLRMACLPEAVSQPKRLGQLRHQLFRS